MKTMLMLSFFPEIYSIFGENGTGKSTILLLILGIYRDKNLLGKILFNGIKLSKLNMNSLRKNNISFMLQYNISFEGTVYEYVQSLLSEHEYNQVMTDKDYNNVFINFQFDIYKIMDKEHDKLSGGEKQLLNLFLCEFKERFACQNISSVYLLDEPTSNIFPGIKEAIYHC